jgi:prepilin-type N-terminal cleavage/methylation domain-containing protein
MKNGRRGFTLIELLIVVVIIGILAAIAIPKFGNSKGKATVAGMKSDLRNLSSVQEAWWVDNRAYYNGLIPVAAFPYTPTKGVVITIVTGTTGGWSAQATAPGLAAETCAIFYGATAVLPPATQEGIVACA